MLRFWFVSRDEWADGFFGVTRTVITLQEDIFNLLPCSWRNWPCSQGAGQDRGSRNASRYVSLAAWCLPPLTQ